MENKSFKFPKSLLNQISECSNGGFMLFNYDGNGKPHMHCHFETTAHELGLQFSIENYNKAMEAYNIESALSEMQPPISPEDEDENEGLL